MLYTLSCKDVTSKAGAGKYALGVVADEYKPLLAEALAIRSGQHGGTGRMSLKARAARRSLMAQYMGYIIDVCNAVYAQKAAEGQ